MLPEIGTLRPWTDPTVLEINRLPMRPPALACPDADAARRGESPWRASLDGRWALRLFDHPDRVSAATITGAADGRAWRRVAVPGNWTLQGVGDHPHYTNVQMPFPGPPPALPERNPTGVYRRGFTVPRRWDGRRIVLHVGGAESVHAVYVNGRFAGYGTDSRLASEYDITSLARQGRNELAIGVVRYSAHSYVEDQDHWWMAGLHRHVFVEARGRVHLDRLVCDAGLRLDATQPGDRGVGTLTVSATTGGASPEPGWRLRCRVETLRGRRVGRAETVPLPDEYAKPYVFAGHTAVASFELAGIEPWSAESPTRYRVLAELLDPEGAVAEAHAALVGFRDVRVENGDLLVNGRRIWVFGANRHDHHPVRGKAVTPDDMRADLLAMRRANITAVRCSHYPNDPALLDLCDELGMYVIDEANIESHAYNTSLCDDPRYRATWLERGARMVERDRNHPSVVLWSLGNEAGDGAHHGALAGWIRAADPSRPLHHEGAILHGGWDAGHDVTDVVCPMYPPIDNVEAYAGDRPLILCEYSHAMGNSNGSLADYWDAITTHPRAQGGFIWEWKDHGLTTTLPNGRRGFAYGGQFGDAPHDGNFVADGLMAADLTPHPAIEEVAWVYRPVAVSPHRGRLRVANRQAFSGLDELDATWELTVAGNVTAAGELDLPEIPPLGSVDADLPCPVPEAADVALTLRFRQRRATPWAPAGHLVAWDQLELTPPAPTSVSATPGRGANRGASLDDRDVTRYLRGPVRLALWRAATDNDGFKLRPDRANAGHGGRALDAWLAAGLDRIDPDELVEHDHEVLDEPDGSQVHTHRVVVPESLADLPRIGATFHLRPGAIGTRWHGRGPLENYPDRNRGAVVGTWEAEVDRPPFLVPQEFGLRTDCRWFECLYPDAAVRIEALSPGLVHCSATHFTAGDLFAAEHETDLRPRRELVVHVDVAHRGLGTASCGPDVLDHYRIQPGAYELTYRLALLPPGG